MFALRFCDILKPGAWFRFNFPFLTLNLHSGKHAYSSASEISFEGS